MFRRTLITAIAATGLALTAVPAMADETLRVGIEGVYPPFSYKESDGTYGGFDVDFAYAVCIELNRECELIPQEWDGMIPALKANKFDVIIASMSITEERATQIDFTNKYYQASARLILRKDAEFEGTADGLAGRRLGMQRGTTHQCYAEKSFPDALIVLYANEGDVYKDLALGRLDAQLTGALVAHKSFLSQDEGADFEFVGGDLVDLECYGEGVGLAVRQGNDELREELNVAIETIRENGSYKEINDKYFPFDIYGD
jgi:arginine/ornithine transport system substrate-binding protein